MIPERALVPEEALSDTFTFPLSATSWKPLVMVTMKLTPVSFLAVVSIVRAAINLDGRHVVGPLTEDDPCPISDLTTYQADQHDCPLACEDYSNTHSWIPYFSVDRLQRCNEPMLLQFSVNQPLDDPASTVMIRSCSLAPTSTLASGADDNEPMENPKKASNLFGGGSLRLAPACARTGRNVWGKLEVASSNDGTADADEVVSLLRGMKDFFKDPENCDESFIFARHKQTVAGIYLGSNLGKDTVESAIEALAARLETTEFVPNHTVAHLCNEGRQPDRIFGISINTAGDMASVQKTARGWSEGNCVSNKHVRPAGYLDDVGIFEIGGTNSTMKTSHSSSLASRWAAGSISRSLSSKSLVKRALCRTIEVVKDDTCAALATRCGISGADFTKYNPSSDFCSTLQPGDQACCSAGDPWKPERPKPNSDGTCATHLIQNGDSCMALAKRHGITVEDIEHWNKGKTWAWTECADMLVGYYMCLSTGLPPMPPPQKGTECGPLVPGTKPPKDRSISLADLNPCPLKACCSNWGFCGVFPAHCDVHAPKDGGPGTKDKGFQTTCVSNCDKKTKKNSGPPESFQRIGYYESFGLDRECLWLKAKNANTDGSYTHIHWAFGSIDPDT